MIAEKLIKTKIIGGLCESSPIIFMCGWELDIKNGGNLRPGVVKLKLDKKKALR